MDSIHPSSASLSAASMSLDGGVTPVLDSLLAGVFVVQGQRVVYVNSAAAEMTGYTLEELTRQDFGELIHPQQRMLIEQRLLRSQAEGHAQERYEIRLVRKDRRSRWIELSTSLIEVDGGPALIGIANDVTDRKRAESRLRRRVTFDNLVEQVFRQFIRADLSAVDAAIRWTLETAGRFADVDRCYVFQRCPTTGLTSNTHEWCREGVAPTADRVQNIGDADFPWFVGRMLRRKTLHVPDVAKLPKDAAREKNEFVAQGIKSLICVPMICAESLVGYVGYDMVREHRRWFDTDEAVALLRIIADVFANALDRNAAHRSLQESEERYRALFQAPFEGVAVTIEGSVVDGNAALENLLGYPLDELRGLRLWDLFESGSRERVRDHVLHDSAEPCEQMAVRRDGRLIHVELQARSLEYRSQQARVVAIRNISQRKLAERALAESQRTLATLLNNLPGMAYRCRNDRDWTMEFVSGGAFELTGYRPDELIDNQRIAYGHAIHPDDREEVWDAVQAGLRERRPFRTTYRLITAEGREREVWEQGQGVYNDSGQLIALEGFITDVTEQRKRQVALERARERLEQRVAERTADLTETNRRLQEAILERVRAESALGESEQRIQSIVDNAPAVIYAKNFEGRYILTNRRFREIFHLEEGQIIGHNDHELFSPEFADAFRSNDLRVLRTGQPLEFEEVVPIEGEKRFFISVKFPLVDARGSVNAVCGVSTDITEQKRVAVELAEARDVAEAASRAKSRFLANMSHEIRTPITAMLGAAELLSQTGPHQRAERAEMILRNGRYLLSLIDDLLDLARIEAGRLQIRLERHSLVELLCDVRAVVESLERAPDVEFRMEARSPLPAEIWTDGTRLKQVLVNLLNNALKFTRQGSVTLALEADDATSELRIDVVDTGTGISPENLQIIFEAFEQLECNAVLNRSGVGLGLPLAKSITERLGGSLSVTSGDGAGATFTVNMRLEPIANVEWLSPAAVLAGIDWPPSQSKDALPQRTLRGRVLLADDFADARHLLATALRSVGARVELASDGLEALHTAGNGEFDLILLDIRMPRLDGIGAVRELRQRGHLGPVIALTASTTAMEIERIMAAGFDDVWGKPLPIGDFVQRCSAFLTAAPDEEVELRHAERKELAEIRSRFASSLPERLAIVRRAVLAGETSEAREILHQLVGAGGTLGYDALSEKAASLLRAVKRGCAAPDGVELAELTAVVHEITSATGSALP